MLRSYTRLLSNIAKNSFHRKSHSSITHQLSKNNVFAFCKDQKHQSNEHHHHDAEKHHEHGPNCNHHHHHQQHHHNPKEAHHQHGPNCKHEHGHLHQNLKLNVKLSKLTFEELIELKTEQSLKYANQIYEQEEKKLRNLQQEKEQVAKNIQFYKKAEEQIRQKEKKLAENIKTVEDETASAKKRADKQIEESKAYAVTKIAKQLLEVADCVASCKKFAQQSEVQDDYIHSVTKSQEIIKQILKKFDIEEFDPTNQQYNPNTQQSLVQVPTPPGYKVNHVAMTMRTGYTIKGRLLRSARVGVFS